MLELARLHLKKERLVFLGLTATLVLSFPFAIAVAPKEVTSPQILSATWLFWYLVGLPGFALLLGGAAGAQLSGDTARAAETLLPIQASRRAWSYFTASAVHLAALVALVAVAGILVNSELSLTLEAPFRWFTHWYPRAFHPYALAFAGSLPYIALVAMVAAYVSGNGLLGGLIGAAVGGVCLLGLLAGITLNQMHGQRVPFLGWAVAGWLTAVLGAASALSETARRIERREKTSWPALARIALTAVAGALLVSGVSLWKERNVRHATRLLGPADYPSSRVPIAYIPQGGTILQSVAGSILWASPDGSRRELYHGNESGFLPSWGDADYQFDAQGTLWLLLSVDHANKTYELWSGKPTEALAIRGRFNAPQSLHIVRRGSEIGLWSWDNDYASVESITQRGPQWVKLSPIGGNSPVEQFGHSAVDAGLAAMRDFGRGTLTQRLPDGKLRSWRVGAPAAADAKLLAYSVEGKRLGGELVFPVSVRAGSGWALKLCRADGRVQELWTTGGDSPRPPWPILSGGLWTFDDHGSVRWVTPEGRVFGPVPFKPHRMEAIRADGDRLWAVSNGKLYVISAGSKSVEEKATLPPLVENAAHSEFWNPIAPAAQGFFFHTGAKLHFVDWDGKSRETGE